MRDYDEDRTHKIDWGGAAGPESSVSRASDPAGRSEQPSDLSSTRCAREDRSLGSPAATAGRWDDLGSGKDTQK